MLRYFAIRVSNSPICACIGALYGGHAIPRNFALFKSVSEWFKEATVKVRISGEEYERISDILDTAPRESADYGAAVREMDALAESGSVEAAESVAEIFSMPGPFHDPGLAYRWYYIALSQQGYTTTFRDQNDIPPHYCGPEGDFRNEAQVNSLVVDLGFARVHVLDQVAEAWLRKRRGA